MRWFLEHPHFVRHPPNRTQNSETSRKIIRILSGNHPDPTSPGVEKKWQSLAAIMTWHDAFMTFARDEAPFTDVDRNWSTACPAPAAAAAAPEARRPPHRARLRVAMNREQIGKESSPKSSSWQGASGDAGTNVACVVLTRRVSSAGRPCQARPRPKKPLWQCGIFTRHGSNWR